MPSPQAFMYCTYASVCTVFVLVCEVLSDTPCSILSGCVSTLIAFSFYPSSPLRSLFFHSVLQLSPFQVGPASFEFLIFLFSMLWALQTIFNCTGIGPHISKAVHLKALQLKPNLCTTSGTKWDFFFLVILVNWSFRVLLYCCSSQGAIHVVLYLGSVPGHGKQN